MQCLMQHPSAPLDLASPCPCMSAPAAQHPFHWHAFSAGSMLAACRLLRTRTAAPTTLQHGCCCFPPCARAQSCHTLTPPPWCVAPQATGVLSAEYWTGLAYNISRNEWVLQGGGSAGSGEVSNANPYAHWAYDFQDVRTANPTFTCVSALSGRKYDMVSGTAGLVPLCSAPVLLCTALVLLLYCPVLQVICRGFTVQDLVHCMHAMPSGHLGKREAPAYGTPKAVLLLLAATAAAACCCEKAGRSA